MATFATQDDFNSLVELVRTLQDDVTTLNSSVGAIDQTIEKINHVEALKDITLTYITEGDVLQYSSDGTWHNVQPAALNIGFGDGEGSPVDSAIVKSLIQSEGAKLFISKLYDDTANGQINFQQGLSANNIVYLNKGMHVGNFTTGFFGSGARIDEKGYGEMTGLTLREFLEVPELRFNKIDVVSGELWNSIAYGTIESVDTENQIATIKLEEGEYSGLHVNDICRGIFHNIDGYNNTEAGIDDCGFEKLQGFSTAYFTPVEIIGERGEKFRYSLKSGTSQHPCAAMKFAVYGNFTDPTRRSSAYATRDYKRYLKDVSTWEINSTLNISSQFGKLDGLYIAGAPNDGNLTGDGAYLSNIYMTDALIQFTPDQEAALKGKDGYAVSLDHYSASVLVNNEYDIINLDLQQKELTFAVQAFRGDVELLYDNVYGEGKYFLEYTATGCEVTFNNGVFQITAIHSATECYVSIIVNCEGNIQIKQTFTVVPLLSPDSLWVTYNDNDALPVRPTGDGTFDGWHRNYTSTAIWMSTKSSRDVNEGEWGDPVRFVGASVAGKDGQYTAFVYTSSSVQPPTPNSNSGLPPKDPAGLYTWHMSPPERENITMFTWMSQCIVYGDKTQSGWSTPIRITGDDGIDGADGADFEFIYGLFTPGKINTPIGEVTLERPYTPYSDPNTADAVPDTNSEGYDNVDWDDNPWGVTEKNQYEWVCTRSKSPASSGKGVWGPWSVPVVWSKWGEKGMDGDGYEYVYTRTADVDEVPDQPKYTGAAGEQEPEFRPYVYINGVNRGDKWTDDPKGIVSEQYKAEWVSKRKRTDMVWSNFSAPALWANWGEQGMQGAHYIYRWCLSASTPKYTANAANPGSNWVNDSELKATSDQFVWQIQCLSNPDGTQGTWGNLIRISGENGKDGEDGNSIEFLYARNNTGIAPSAPPTNQINDWTGDAIDNNNGGVTIKWEDNPQGVTANIMYEWVCQRYKNRETQLWEAYSTPGLWSRYAEKGKDGDGYEYIYRRFGEYQSQAPVSSGGAYYPPTNSADYQNDDYVPANYTDNPQGPTSSLPYEYVWTRKKEQGTWGVWKPGALWSRWQPSTFKSTVFTRNNSTPGRPSGGSWSSPVPTTTGWDDGIPSGTAIVWASTRIFTEDGNAPQDAEWSLPQQMTDTASFDVEWSSVESNPGNPTSNPSNWSNTASSSTIWMATRTMQNGVWSNWTVAKIKGENGKDGAQGPQGPTGPAGDDGADGADGTDGRTYYVNGCPASIRSRLAYLQTTSVTLKSVYTNGTNTTTGTGYGYWAAYRKTSGGSWHEIDRQTSESSSFSPSWSSSLDAVEFWFGFSTDSADASSLSPTYSYSVWSQRVPVVYDGQDGDAADASYTIMRDQGYWTSGVKYYNAAATSAMDSSEYTKYENYSNLTVVDYVQYKGAVYLCNTTHTASVNPESSDYWNKASKQQVLTVNNLLANHAKLGEFSFSNNVFTSSNGNLSMNSSTGSFKCVSADIQGKITATSGTIGGFTIGTSTLTAGTTYPMTITASGTGDFTSSGIVWKNSANDRLLSLGVSSQGGDIRVRNSSLYQVSITPASVFLNGGSSITINAQSSTPSFEILRSVQNPDYRIYMSVDSSGVADIRCRLKDNSGSTIYSGKIQIRNHDGYAMLILK